MFCSTIIPTVNRPSLVRAVSSVLQQDFPKDQFEVIVVNDSGQPLTKADWQQSAQVRVIETNRRNRSVARNAGAAIAKGTYLHFLDDDDCMMPGAFAAFWELSCHSQAAWLHGAFQFVDDSGEFLRDVTLNLTGNCFVQIMVGEWIPIQASFIQAVPFFSVGGFAPLSSLLGGSEDIDLSRMICHDFAMAFTPTPVATIRRGIESSTTDYSNLFDQLRQSREKGLSLPGSFSRMRFSAREAGEGSAYWNGYIVYLYLVSTFHNLFRQRRFFTALSRGFYAVAAFFLAGTDLFKLSFWRGIREKYISPSFI
ncbi:MAG TPA: glycosyltransferase family A protein [Chloroflexota bacterium]|nr:glycosyltransferase family A protein [Chloroflexota bacterium]HUM67663.1 glycosyltransferase family A protein [Chloroflexota bacterium]